MSTTIRDFLVHKLASGKSPATVETDRGHLERFCKGLHAGAQVDLVEQADVEKYLHGLGKPGKAASPSYRNRARASLSHFFEWAKERGLTKHNPVSHTAPARNATRQRDYVTEEEYEAIMAAVEAAEKETGVPRGWLKDWIAFAWGTGLRPDEQHTLAWNAVDLVGGTVHVGKHGRGKTANSFRFVPVTGEALAVLQQRSLETSNPGGLVFTGAGGDPVEQSYLRKNLKRFAKDAGIDKNVVPYSFRHGYGTRMIQAQVPAFELAKIMGTSLQMIEKHYGHHDQTRAAGHVRRVFGPISGTAAARIARRGASGEDQGKDLH